MEEALLEPVPQTIEEVPRERDLNDLLKIGNIAEELETLIHSEDFSKLDYNAQVEVAQAFLSQKRWDNQFDIPAYKNDAEKYQAWDKNYAREIVGQLQMEAISPADTPSKTEIATSTLTAEEQARDELRASQTAMEAIMPAKKTNVERYTELVASRTAKLQELETKAETELLTPEEDKRLAEIKSDIAHFSERMQKAIAAEQAVAQTEAPEAPIEVIETLPTIEAPIEVAGTPAPVERTPTAVREELIELNKEKKVTINEQSAPTVAVDIIPNPSQPAKPGLWSRLISGFKLESETPASIPTPTKKDMFFAANQPPESKLRPVDKVNDGVKIRVG